MKKWPYVLGTSGICVLSAYLINRQISPLLFSFIFCISGFVLLEKLIKK